jgi:TPP-dependent indolepyruvate ferredoxin oxidoreductase alpha subunit
MRLCFLPCIRHSPKASFAGASAFVRDFIKGKDAVIILEELEPILEDFTRQIAQEAKPNLIIHGKDLLPDVGEYNLETVIPAFGKIFGKELYIDLDDHKKKLTWHRRISQAIEADV